MNRARSTPRAGKSPDDSSYTTATAGSIRSRHGAAGESQHVGLVSSRRDVDLSGRVQESASRIVDRKISGPPGASNVRRMHERARIVCGRRRALRSAAPATRHRLSIVAPHGPNRFARGMGRRIGQDRLRRRCRRLEHGPRGPDQWWDDFWNRSWIHATGPKDTQAVSQGYAIQRFMIACCGRGDLPIKFNGAMFTVDATYGRIK